MPGIGIIANPHSKLNKRSPLGLAALQEVAGQKGSLTITRDLDHLDETLAAYKKRKIDILAINGGDGTISQAITRMIGIYGDQELPILAVLRGGTMNLIAAQLGVHGTPPEILKRIMGFADGKQSFRIQELSTLKIDKVYGFLYADQTSTAMLEEFYRKKSGRRGASWLALKITSSYLSQGDLYKRLVQTQQLKASLKPAAQFDEQVLGAFAGTISKFPLGLPFLPLATRFPGHFQMMMVTCKPEQLLWHMPLFMLQQREGPGFGKSNFTAREAVLQYEGEVRYTVDGEIYSEPSGRLVIEAGPTLRFLSI